MNTISLDSKVCEQTAKDAVQAGCPPSAALEIAERVANIDNDLSIPKLYESIEPLSQPGVATGPHITSADRRPEDYVSAAVAAKASMTEAQLVEHISQLAEALATHHQREALELSGTWAAILPNWEIQRQEKTGKIQEEFTTRKKLGKETCETELKELAARRLQEALQDAVEEVQERSERDIYDLYSSTNLQLQEDLTGAIRSFDSYFRGLPEIFTRQVQELWNQGHCPQHRVAKAPPLPWPLIRPSLLKNSNVHFTESCQNLWQLLLNLGNMQDISAALLAKSLEGFTRSKVNRLSLLYRRIWNRSLEPYL